MVRYSFLLCWNTLHTDGPRQINATRLISETPMMMPTEFMTGDIFAMEILHAIMINWTQVLTNVRVVYFLMAHSYLISCYTVLFKNLCFIINHYESYISHTEAHSNFQLYTECGHGSILLLWRARSCMHLLIS